MPLSGTFFSELILTKVPLNGIFVGQTTKCSRGGSEFGILSEFGIFRVRHTFRVRHIMPNLEKYAELGKELYLKKCFDFDLRLLSQADKLDRHLNKIFVFSLFSDYDQF